MKHKVERPDKIVLQGKTSGLEKQIIFTATPTIENDIETIKKLTSDMLQVSCSQAVLCRRAMSCYRQHLQNIILENRRNVNNFMEACQAERDELFHAANRTDKERFKRLVSPSETK